MDKNENVSCKNTILCVICKREFTQRGVGIACSLSCYKTFRNQGFKKNISTKEMNGKQDLMQSVIERLIKDMLGHIEESNGVTLLQHSENQLFSLVSKFADEVREMNRPKAD